MKKQIKNETESYYLKFLSDKYCSFESQPPAKPEA